MSLEGDQPYPHFEDARFRMAFARIVTPELHLVNIGHIGGPDMTTHLIAATDRFADQ